MSDHWKDQKEYVPIVERMKQLMPDTHKPYVDDTSCFGWLWIDNGTECDQTQCGLRSYCRNTWQMGQLKKAAATKTTDLTHADVLKKDLAASSRKRPIKRKSRSPRGKYKDTSKYNRVGYVDKGREIDALASTFREAIGTYHHVVKKWLPAELTKHPIALKTTASYHALIVSGVIVVRLWTNTLRTATLDLVPELVTAISELSRQPENAEEITEPYKVSEKVMAKIKPCTHRVSVFTHGGMKKVVAIIRDKFRFAKLRGDDGKTKSQSTHL